MITGYNTDVRHADLVVAAGGQSEAELAESIKQALRDGGYHDALLPGNPLTGSTH